MNNKPVIIDENKCIGCGLCVKDCPNRVIKLKDEKAEYISASCMECGHCLAICPKNAISMSKYNMEEVVEYDAEMFDIPSQNFLNHIKFRRSIRHFKDINVEKEKIEQIIEAGRYTPTGTNKQTIRYIVSNNPEQELESEAIKSFNKIKKVGDFLCKFIKMPIDTRRFNINSGFFFHHAPTVILVISDDEVDASLASANMETMAQSLGLGVLYVGFYVVAAKLNKKINKQLGLSKKEKIVTAIAIGYPSIKYKRTVPRKAADIKWL